jgi:AraC-like DNA-binding protein
MAEKSTGVKMPAGPATDVTKMVRRQNDPAAGTLDLDQPYAAGIGARYHLEDPEGSGFREFIRPADDLFIVAVDTRAHVDWFFKFVEQDFLTFHFRLSGASRELFEEQGMSEPDGPFCSVNLYPSGVERAVWIPSRTHFRTVSVKMKPGFIPRVLGEVPDYLPPALLSYLHGGPPEFFSYQLPLTPEMKRVSADLIDNRFERGLRRAYAESKAVELICETLMAFANRTDVTSLPVRLMARDIEHLKEAHAILSRTFVNPPAFPALARKIGVNRNKLAYGFKHLYGVTTSQFCQVLRMERAMQLLKTGQTNVAEAAEAVGYLDPGGFAKTFKKHFGFLPKDLLKAPPSR